MTFLRIFALLLVVSGCGTLLAQQQPTAEEVAFIYELNRARQNPQRYETENGLTAGLLAAATQQPPLALNLSLVESARWHSQDMATNGYFAHTRPAGLGGQQPNWMARHKWKGSNPPSAYPLYSSWPDAANYIESLAALYSSTAISYAPTDALRALIVDAGVTPPGHRIHLLAMSASYELHREIGTGYAEGLGASGWSNGAYWSIHTGRRDTTPVWLTGVVYDDANNNGRFDQGEGLSGVTIAASGSASGSVQTGTNGMWMMQGTPGSTTLTCSGGSFVGTATRTFTIASDNMAIDFASGRSDGELDFEFQQVGGGPSLTVSSSMNAFNSPTAATPSAEQSYTVSGVRLTGNVTVNAPSEFQVSLTSGSGFATSVVLTPSSGTLATTTIYVRFNPSGSNGANGFITHDASGIVDSPINVVGTVSTNPAVFTAPNSLTLTAVQLGASSPELSYVIEGYNLSANITVTAPSDFEVSLVGGGAGFSGGVTVPHAGGIVSPTTIYVRYVPTTLGATGNITNVSGASSANVALTGNVTNAPVITRNPSALTMVSPTVGAPSGEQSFTVSGQYLGGDITLTAPAGFEITQTSGSGYTGSIVLLESGGTVASTTVYVRYQGGAGGSTANLTCTSNLASTVNVSLTGQIAPPPNITLSASSHSFTSPLIGSPSSPKTYTVSGTNMIGDVTINVTGEFEVALAAAGPYAPSATITVTGATLTATTVYIRYTASSTGPASGTATHTSPGATNRFLALAGSIGSGGSGSGGSGDSGGGCAVTASHTSAALLVVLLLVPVLLRRRKRDDDVLRRA